MYTELNACSINRIMARNYDRLEVIGLLPAGGQATRISPLPCSKELYPIGFRYLDDGSLRPKVVSHYLLEKMRLAGIRKAYFVLRPNKWDIPAYFGDGTFLNMNLGYLIMGLPFGVPYTLDQAYSFVKDAVVAFGFPDILFQPEDTFKRLIQRLNSSNADVVVVLLPLEHSHKGGMVDLDAEGHVRQIVEKPAQSDSRYSWCTAVWAPAFTEFMHHYLAVITNDDPHYDSAHNPFQQSEIPLGNVIQAAIDKGLRVVAEIFDGDPYLDIGTPEDLGRAVRTFATQMPETK
jgi:glucose-1-phosphate thymidylyltransferase